jgi:hypothetical protein
VNYLITFKKLHLIVPVLLLILWSPKFTHQFLIQFSLLHFGRPLGLFPTNKAFLLVPSKGNFLTCFAARLTHLAAVVVDAPTVLAAKFSWLFTQLWNEVRAFEAIHTTLTL